MVSYRRAFSQATLNYLLFDIKTSSKEFPVFRLVCLCTMQ
ncbi:Hypothetical protein I595_878 [Croceitalea dokdonensis DOKDO 023]|uniref:Uncharacterized protein n=1 Tax=Croceitalea dokdonensis DOKDO 023 TaxID=1300341 RepID=A0A0P7AG90_9FLAO|nr:Hypothetical protein I595_878 [Croceitalea dokdonensis DOKDO 023]